MSNQKSHYMKIRLTPAERHYLDHIAQAEQVTRSEFIRSQCLEPKPIAADPRSYIRCVEAAARLLPGASRLHIEAAVAKVICELAANGQKSSESMQ